MKEHFVAPKKRKTNYINNKDLYDHMVIFIDNRNKALKEGREPPQISNYIGLAIDKIARRLITKPNFSGYSEDWKMEMIADGIENCIMYLHNFNPQKSNNPFAYITLIIWRAFIRRIEKEKKHSYIKHKLMYNRSVIDENAIGAEDYAYINSVMESNSNEKSADIIAQFEGKIERKKQKNADRAAARELEDVA